MRDAQREAVAFGAVDELQGTAGVGAGDNRRARGPDVPELPVEQRTQDFRLGR